MDKMKTARNLLTEHIADEKEIPFASASIQVKNMSDESIDKQLVDRGYRWNVSVNEWRNKELVLK